jgi:type II secretory pathway pseudopilin PulG
MDPIPALQTALYGPHGFTLLGALMAFGLLSVLLALARFRSIQAPPSQDRNRGKSIDAKEIRGTGGWINGNALNAQAAVHEYEDPLVFYSAAANVTIRRTGGGGVRHPSTYLVSGDVTDREYYGRINAITAHVMADSVGFLHCGNFLTLEPSEFGQPGSTPKSVLWTYLRKQG